MKTEKTVKYPVSVQLTGCDGNAFMLIVVVQRALRKAGVPDEEVSAFVDEAMNQGSYDELLQFLMRTVDVR